MNTASPIGSAAGRGSAGHTLVELLLSAGIALVMAGLIFEIAGNAANAWRRVSTRVEAAAEMESLLDQLVRDLEGAWSRPDGGVWLAATILAGTENSGMWEPAGSTGKPGWEDARTLSLTGERISECRFGAAGTWLRFFTTRPSDNTTTARLSNPVAVGYQIVRRRPIGASGGTARYILFRSQVTPANTWSAGWDLDPEMPPAAGQTYTRPNGTDGHAGSLLRPNLANSAAVDVIDFGVRFFRRSEAGWVLSFPLSDRDTEYLARPGNGPSMPHAVEVHLRSLTPEGVRRISRLEAGLGEGDWWDVALEHSIVYSRWVELPAEVW